MKVNTDAYYTEMQTEVVNQLKNVNEYNPYDVLIKMRKNCKNFDKTPSNMAQPLHSCKNWPHHLDS